MRDQHLSIEEISSITEKKNANREYMDDSWYY